jgi:hypothetical protein
MITGVLEFIHARKWLVELVLLLALAGGVWWFCQHLIDVGVQRQKDDDAKAYAELQRKADLETGRLQGVADAAEKARAQEHADDDQYRRDHPLHGGLCLARQLPATASAQTGAAHVGDEAAGTGAADLQRVSPGDPGVGGQGDPDVRHLLDVLAGRADFLSATLREFQARAQ